MFKPAIAIYKYNDLKIMLVTDGHTIEQCLEAFENVLRGSGYVFDGHIDIIDESNN